ncbi:hypothetical protein RRG08_065741 [Elysia crispata]|uniref:Uncharacterized protein n=1 Tax=Elysia crispata TaxID=231223 RepID=A0AAE0Z6N8_9GAST|nr:hypothetical protein RRG08_065741 [Elysia crispata]
MRWRSRADAWLLKLKVLSGQERVTVQCTRHAQQNATISGRLLAVPETSGWRDAGKASFEDYYSLARLHVQPTAQPSLPSPLAKHVISDPAHTQQENWGSDLFIGIRKRPARKAEKSASWMVKSTT